MTAPYKYQEDEQGAEVPPTTSLQTPSAKSSNLKVVVASDGTKSLLYRDSGCLSALGIYFVPALVFGADKAFRDQAPVTGGVLLTFAALMCAFVWWTRKHKVLLSYKDGVLSDGRARVHLNGSEELCQKPGRPPWLSIGLKVDDEVIWYGEGGNRPVLEAKILFLSEVLKPLQQTKGERSQGLIPASPLRKRDNPWVKLDASAQPAYRTSEDTTLRKTKSSGILSLLGAIATSVAAIGLSTPLVLRPTGPNILVAMVICGWGIALAHRQLGVWRGARKKEPNESIRLPAGYVSMAVHRMVGQDPFVKTNYEVRVRLSSNTEVTLKDRLSAEEAHQIVAAAQSGVD